MSQLFLHAQKGRLMPIQSVPSPGRDLGCRLISWLQKPGLCRQWDWLETGQENGSASSRAKPPSTHFGLKGLKPLFYSGYNPVVTWALSVP